MVQKYYALRLGNQWAQIRRAEQKPKTIRTVAWVKGLRGKPCKLVGVWHDGGKIIMSVNRWGLEEVFIHFKRKPLRKNEVKEIGADVVKVVKQLKKAGDL